MSAGPGLKARIFAASKWSVLSELASKSITPIVYVLLARLLSPTEFGVVSAAAIVVSFSQILWDVGMSKALIQKEKDIAEAADITFYSNTVLGLVVYALVFAFAGPIASLFHDPRVSTVLRVQGLQLVLSSLGSVQIALYQRALNFKPLFLVRLATTALPGLASVPLAYFGFGYWALICGTLVGATVQLAVLWKLSPWRPRRTYHRVLAGEMIRFGLWASAEGLLCWFYAWADSMVVGAFLGSRELGLYRTGSAFTIMLFGLVLSPVTPVLYSSFSRLQTDQVMFVASVIKATKLLSLVALPVGIGAFLIRDPLAAMVFGPKWDGVGPVIGALCLLNAFSWVVGANTEAYRAVGRPDLSAKIMLFCLVFYLPTYLFVAPRGLQAFLVARVLLGVLAFPIHLTIGKSCLGVRPWQLVLDLRWVLFATGFMTAVVYYLMTAIPVLVEKPASLVGLVLIGAISYVAIAWRDRGVSSFVGNFLLRRT